MAETLVDPIQSAPPKPARRLGQRARRFARLGLGILAVLGVVALAAPLLAPYDPAVRTGMPFARPSAVHPLGTNDVGQDLLSELLYGARASLLVGIVAASAATLIGAGVGIVAGYARGWLEGALMRLVDVVLALPVLPLTIVMGVFLGPGLGTQMFVIAAVIWAGVSRELRSQVLSVRERDHIQAARAMGGRSWYVLRRHVVPGVAPLVVPQFVLATKTAILLEASLAFLGLGDAGAKSWGTMLYFAHARSAFLTDAWLWWVVPPGVAIAITVLGFALLGFAFEERSRPSLKDSVPRRKAGAQPAGAAPTCVSPDICDTVLRIERLSVAYGSEDGPTVAVEGVDLELAAGEVLGLVGESGSGKSTVAAAAIGLLPAGARVVEGRVLIDGEDAASIPATKMRRLRGKRIALVPQEALNALNPVHTIGKQIAEALRAHDALDRAQVRRRVNQLLTLVSIDPDRALDYPHQLSGGMRQRVVIAIAVANDPAVLIADEPTSGLDVIVQAEILDLLKQLGQRLNLAVLLISHDLPVVERVADRVAVMCEGRVVETVPAARMGELAGHPYTRRLLEAVPRQRLSEEAPVR
ncbi:MAG: dipeptide/oligopeptide/nickel ABC transporter permease/ATP-binding protein [Actinomycetota bacterium]